MSGEEELPQPTGVAGRLARLPGAVLVGAALLAAAAVLAGVLLTGHRAAGARPRGRPTTVAAGAAAHGAAAPAVPVAPARLQLPATCPRADDGQVACTTYRGVPPAFVAAMRAVLPHLRVVAAVTDVLRATDPEVLVGLWSRRFSGRAGAAVIGVVVTRGRVGLPTAREALRGGRVVLYCRAVDGLYTVQVQVRAPAASAPALPAVERLAADPRLVRAFATRRGTMAR